MEDQQPNDFRKSRRRERLADPTKIDRLPPHDIAAEQGILGCIMLSPKECLDECIEALPMGPAIFYDLRHVEIYKTMLEMVKGLENIDLITLQARLRNQNQLESVGGVAYISSLVDAVPSAANLSYYLTIADEKYKLRQMIRTCTDVVSRAYEHEGEVDNLLNQVQADINAISKDSRVQDKTIKEIMTATLAKIQDSFENYGKGIRTGLQTGHQDLDNLVRLTPQEMIIIGARPSVGKTSLAMEIAQFNAIELKAPVQVYSFEMSDVSLGTRALANLGKINLKHLTDGRISERDFPNLVQQHGRIIRSPLHIHAGPGMEILTFQAHLRRAVQEHGIKLAVIDYLQLMKSVSKKATMSRQIEISEISSGIKASAMELGIPIIVLSQLNRDLEKGKRKPKLSDLRESGSLEQDGDVIMLMSRVTPEGEDEDAPNKADADPYPVAIDTVKNKNGPTGTVHLQFTPQSTRFDRLPKVDDADVPTT